MNPTLTPQGVTLRIINWFKTRICGISKKRKMGTVVSNNIKSLRRLNRWEQKYVANRLNMSLCAYAKIERGIPTLNFPRLLQIADLFDVSVAQLLGSEDERTSSESFVLLQNKIKNLQQKENYIISLQQKIDELLDELGKKRLLVG